MKIGVDYYPEHWDKSLWQQDVCKMKEVGVGIVRMAEFAWCKMEPQEGEFDFSWLDEIIDLFEEQGIEVFLCTPTNTPPLWLYEKYPEAIQVDKSGHRIPIGIRGHRCYNSPIFRTYAERIIRRMVEHFSSRKSVIGWQIDNELEANHCCCTYCTDAFRKWMLRKYGVPAGEKSAKMAVDAESIDIKATLKEINEVYGNNVWSGEYSSLEQITPPFGPYQTWLHPSYMLDFNRYASDSTVEYVRWQADLIREICPDTQLTTNNWLCENMPDFYEMFAELDFVSYDNYPASRLPENPEDLYSHAFHLDLMRGIKQQNFWIMEQLSGPTGGWAPIAATPRPGMIKGYSLQAIAHGADAVLHFRWRTAKSGAEMFWHGILDASNVPGRRYEEFEELCHTVEKLSCLDGTVIKNDIAILYASDQEYALKIQPQAEGMHYFNQLKSLHDGFTRTGLGVDIIDWRAELSSYKVVIVPTLFVTDKEVTKHLYRFAEEGGTVVLTNRSGVKETHNTCIMEPLPTVFAELAGVHVTEYEGIGYRSQKLKIEEKHLGTLREAECTCWIDLLACDTAEVVASYDDQFYKGTPAVTRNQYGKGVVYYLGTVCRREFYYALAKEILEDLHMEHYQDLPVGIEMTIRQNETGQYLFVFNNTEEEKEVRLQKGYSYESVIGGELLLDTGLCLQPFEMRIYKIKRASC